MNIIVIDKFKGVAETDPEDGMDWRYLRSHSPDNKMFPGCKFLACANLRYVVPGDGFIERGTRTVFLV